MKRSNSENACQEAVKYIPGGVNSPVRALRSVGEMPLFIRKASGSRITDIDGNHFTDFCLSWGVFILGHGHPAVKKAARKAISAGTSYGIPSVQETDLAIQVNKHMPGIEKVRFVNSGTEAVMSAVRLARGYTGRNTIIKFDGCYHGHVDHLLVTAGSGVARLNSSSSTGIPDSFISHTISLPFNDKAAIEHIFREKGNKIAAVMVEPVPANMGVVLPENGFLSYLREITAQHNSLLIFDEVITGFRLAPGGAQEVFDIQPDLTTIGKIVGGGFPAAAFGGKATVMDFLAPDGPVYQAGTLSGNPVAMSAGYATLELVSADGFYKELNAKSAAFMEKLKDSLSGKGIRLNHTGSMFTLFFTPDKVRSFEDAKKSDQQRFARFFRHMLTHHFYISPSQFEANFISSVHTEKELNRFIHVVSKFQD